MVQDKISITSESRQYNITVVRFNVQKDILLPVLIILNPITIRRRAEKGDGGGHLSQSNWGRQAVTASLPLVSSCPTTELVAQSIPS